MAQPISSSTASLPDFHHSPAIDQVGVEERIERLSQRSIKKESKIKALKLLLQMLDLTTLEGKDTPGKVTQMCYKARHLCDALPDLPTVAAVCVYPEFVRVAKEALRGSTIQVASVATFFPSGHGTMQAKVEETKRAVGDGADEIDMVISRGRFLAGDYGFTFDEVATIKAACGSALLK
ncbi:MAG: deoxyribose-phosphate aldolase, partial [Proteobacteria bacterium]|nr:deoxyribose-phosphate aldolase [Pseudomonadota bacterium]